MMLDPRYTHLAEVLVHHSVRVQPGEKILVEAFDIPTDFTVELIRTISQAGGLPLCSTYHNTVLNALCKTASEDQMRLIGDVERCRMEAVQGYIGVRGSFNIAEMSDVPPDRMALYEKHWWHRVHSEVRVPHTKWVVLRWPLPSMAQSANMSTRAFEDFYFRVCAEVDYERMARSMEPLKELMEKTENVRITGPNTNLSFSKKGIPAIGCSGERNIPDGEMFTCPVKDSINGFITFNTETIYRGKLYNNIRLEFEQGRIASAEAGSGNTQALNDVLDADEGARYVGEWSLGFNPEITFPLKDILFDEKIAGSFHLTPGQAYEEADNGNRSQIHWDMVMMQTPERGGGSIYFDDVLIRQNGMFVIPELEALNPKNRM